MRFFDLQDFQMVVLLVFLGLTALILLYIAFSTSAPSRRGQQKEEIEEFPEGIQTTQKPIPLILILVYAGFIIWAIAYAIFIGIRGGPF